MGIVCAIMGFIMAYLIGQVAYREGRKSKWEEMCREYICIHKSVCIRTCERTERTEKTLDKKNKKRYNVKAYKQKRTVKP